MKKELKEGETVIAVKPEDWTERPYWMFQMDEVIGQVGVIDFIQKEGGFKVARVIFQYKQYDQPRQYNFAFRNTWLKRVSNFNINVLKGVGK